LRIYEKYNGVDLLCFLLIHYAIKARIDAPGALQHIICRGIEHRKIFTDTADKNNFVARLGRVIVVRLFNGYERFWLSEDRGQMSDDKYRYQNSQPLNPNTDT
jgi:hypothetical protein